MYVFSCGRLRFFPGARVCESVSIGRNLIRKDPGAFMSPAVSLCDPSLHLGSGSLDPWAGSVVQQKLFTFPAPLPKRDRVVATFTLYPPPPFPPRVSHPPPAPCCGPIPLVFREMRKLRRFRPRRPWPDVPRPSSRVRRARSASVFEGQGCQFVPLNRDILNGFQRGTVLIFQHNLATLLREVSGESGNLRPESLLLVES